MDAIDDIRAEIRQRMAILAPLVDEARRLEQALAALDRVAHARAASTPLNSQDQVAQATGASTRLARREGGHVSDADLLVKARELGDFNVPELAAALGAKRSTVAKRVASLAQRGALVRRGGERGPSARWAVRSVPTGRGPRLRSTKPWRDPLGRGGPPKRR